MAMLVAIANWAQKKSHQTVTMTYPLTISLVYVYQFHTQRWTLRHGTTTGSYVAPYGMESAMEFVRVVGKSFTGRNYNLV